MRAWCATHQFGSGDQSVAEGNLFDNIGVVAGPAEPLIDDIDQTDMVGAVEPCVHEVGTIDVEDDESGGAVCDVALVHTVIMTRGCHTVHSRPITLTYPAHHC